MSNTIHPTPALTRLGVFVDALEKLHTLPSDEIVDNKRLKDEISQVLSVHNVDGMLSSLAREVQEQGLIQHHISNNDFHIKNQQLLHIYAQREHERLQKADAPVYHTKIVGYNDSDYKPTTIANKAKGAIEKSFATAYNTVYANGALKINTDQDPSLLNSYIDYTPYRINYAHYLAIPTLQGMIKRPINMAIKNKPLIKSKNQEFVDAADKFFVTAQLRNVHKDSLFFSALSPRGSLTVPVLRPDGTVSFNVYNDSQFSYGISHGVRDIMAPYASTRVGDIWCLGVRLKHGVSCWFNCEDFEPLFGVGFNKTPILKQAAEAWNLYIHVLKILLVRSQVIIEKLEGDMQTDTMLTRIRTQLSRLSKDMGVSTPIEQPRGASIDILNNNISAGTTQVADVFKEFVGSVSGVASEYFFGGGNSNYSQAAFQIASTNENIRAEYQIGQIEPQLRFELDTAIAYDKRFAQFKGVEYEIEFESLYDETDQERAELIDKKTRTLIEQRKYSELEKAFKHLGLLDKDVSFVGMHPDHDGDDQKADGIPIDSKESVLKKPLK